MDQVFEICHRMIYLYNIAHEEPPLFLNSNDYPVDPKQLKDTVDMFINHINFSNLSESFQKVWMEDKFAYVTWIRDYLIEQVNDTQLVIDVMSNDKF